MLGFHGRLSVGAIASNLTINPLRWFRYTQRNVQWINKLQRFEVIGNTERVRLPKSWTDVITKSSKSRKKPFDLSQVDG